MELTAEKRKEVKEKFAKQIREQFLRPSDYIFGGYVRDTIAGDEYKDIDIFLPNYPHGSANGAKRDFISNLQRIFGYAHVRSQGDRGCYHGNVSLRKTRVEVRLEGYWIAIDLVSGEDASEPFGTLDADVNALYMTRDGQVFAAPSLDSQQIIPNIKAKRFVPYTSDPTRLNKLAQKGYQAMIKPQDTYKVGDNVVVKLNRAGLPSDAPYDVCSEQTEVTIVGVYKRYLSFNYVVALAAGGGGDRLGSIVSELESFDTNYTGNIWSIPAISIVGIKVQEEKETEKHMSTEKNMGVIETFKSDAGDAGYRIAAKQISKGARAGLLALMRAKGAKRSWIKAVSEMMETEGGLAAISVALGWAMKYVPGLKDDTRAIALSKEFRVEGMAMGGNLLVDEAAEYFLPILMQIKNLPEPPKVRVSDTQSAVRISTAEVTDECEEDEPVVAPRTQTACQ